MLRKLLALLVLGQSLWLCCASSPGEKPPERQISERLVARTVDEAFFTTMRPETATVSPDGRRVAYETRAGKSVVLDGREGKAYAEAVFQLTFSPDSSRLAYQAQTGAPRYSRVLVVDGKDGKHYRKIYAGPIFSPDSKHLAYVAEPYQEAAYGWVVVHDGKDGEVYTEVEVHGREAAELAIPVFSPNSERLAHVAYVIGPLKAIVVVDGSRGQEYDDACGPTFSPDSKRLAYTAKVGGRWLVVLDGKEGERYDAIGEAVFSPDSKRVAYAAEARDKHLVVLDGEDGEQYDDIPEDSLVFGPDSKRAAYTARAGNKWFVVVDGERGKPYAWIGPPYFSPDGKRLAYVAETGGKCFVVVDGEEGRGYDDIGSLTFSPDSKRLAYWARLGGQSFVVLDGEEGERYKSRFSVHKERTYVGRGGERVSELDVALREKSLRTYTDDRGTKWHEYGVLPARERKDYDTMAGEPVTFSPDSKRVAYAANRGGKWSVVVEGKEGRAYDGFPSPAGARIVFDSPNELHYLALKGNEIYLIGETLP